MSDALRELMMWFPTGTAEGERSIAEQTFVYVNEFEKVLSIPEGSPRLLVGRKGSGKSAVIDFAKRVLDKQGVPALVIKPKDINTSGLSDGSSVGDLRRLFSSILMLAIVTRLSRNVPNFATGDDATIYHAAIESGTISPDAVGRLSRLLPSMSKPLVKLDLTEVFPKLTSVTRKELESAVSRSLKGKRFYIYIDDTDQVASPDRPGHLNRIWGLVLAARDLCEEMPEVRIVITLRSEVWERLQRDEAGQRDQTDHFTNLIVKLSSDEAQIKKILERRLELARDACSSSKSIYDTFFESAGARAPMSTEFRSWADLILGRSRERPRDTIQLVHSLADTAIAAKRDSIDESIFHKVMPVFSANRVKLFDQEVEREFKPAADIIDSFATTTFENGRFILSAEEARNHLKSIMGRFQIILFGKILHQNSENDIISVWRFLYNAHVLNARISDSTMKDGYRHERPDNDPMLVVKSRWNDMQGMLWEINTAFRDHLVTKRAQHEANTGLPIRPPKRRRRGG
jgi:hypothetical protein